MNPPLADPATQIRSWHAHVYFDGPQQRQAAATLREAVAQRFALQLGRWHEVPVGPHTRAMYQLAFEPALFAQVVPFLALNRQGLDVLVHPNTLAPRADHLLNALWLGQPLALKDSVLPQHISAEDDDPVLINSQPR